MNTPEHVNFIHTYAEFRDDIEAFANGEFNFLIVIGATGLGKTETVREIVGPHYLLEGQPSAWMFYCGLYEHRDQTVILDDVSPKFYREPTCQSLLKSLTNTRSIKRLQWQTASTGPDKNYPQSFETTSRCLILTNDWSRPMSEHVRAIEGRANFFVFDPSPSEVFREVARRGWFQDEEVFRWVWEHRQFVIRPDMRLFHRIAEHKRAKRPWHKRALEMLIGKQRLVELAELLKDPRFTSNRKRAEEFARRGYGYRRTSFYQLLKEFRWYLEDDPPTEPPRLNAIQQQVTVPEPASRDETTSWIYPSQEERCQILPYPRPEATTKPFSETVP